MESLFYFLHFLTAADEGAPTDLGHLNLIATDVAPVFLTNFFDSHVHYLL